MTTHYSSRRLPSCEVLREHIAAGMTKRAIAERYGVTPEAVRQQFVKCEIEAPRERPTHSHYVPWRLRADHVGHIHARRLRLYSKVQQGIRISDVNQRQLQEWTEWMDGANAAGVPLAVHYDRTDSEGFWVEPRQPGDRDYISPPIE